MENIEGVLTGAVNSVLEDAIVYLLTTKSNRPLEELGKYLGAYALKNKMDPGPQATAPSPEAETLEKSEIMALCDPVFQHLALLVTKQVTDPSSIPAAMSTEMNRLLEDPEELGSLTKGLYSPAMPEPDQPNDEDDERRLNYD